MKRILLILALLLSGISVSAQRKVLKECTLHYDIEDFPVKEKGDMIIVDVVPDIDMLPFYDNDLPELPRFLYKVYEGDFYDELEFDWEINSLEKVIFKENVDIATMLPTKPHDFSECVKFEDFDEYNKILINVDRNYGTIRLWVTPFEYDQNTRTLYFIKDIDLTVRINNKTSRGIIRYKTEPNRTIIIKTTKLP